MFTAPDEPLASTSLSTIPELREQSAAVLWALAGNAPDNIFVAGDDGVVFHFDGKQWLRENLGSKLNVHALCFRGEALFSVGWLGRICVRKGGRWQPLQGGRNEAATVNQPLFDCAADALGSLWAVGDQGRVSQYDGRNWIEHSSGTTANLRAVLPLPDGRILAGGLGGTVLELRDGAWRDVATNTACPIVSMAALSDDTVIAVGGEYDIDVNQFRGRIFRYRDGHWLPVAVDRPLPRLRRVRREGNNLLITGDGGTALRWTAAGVSELPTRLRYDLHDVISFAEGRALICGDAGTVLQEAPRSGRVISVTRGTKAAWRKISGDETNKTLRTLWLIDNSEFMAAGDSGVVVHYRHGEITLSETPGKLRIHDLWGTSRRNIFAVCDAASILHFDGEQWRVAHRAGSDTALLAITGFGPHDIFATGDNGYALRYDGLLWRQIETGVKQELYGLWGCDSQHLLAVGGGGVVLRWNGERWKSFGAGTDQDLYSVHGSSLNKLFLAGLAGTLIRFEDDSWHREFSGVRSDLHCVGSANGVFYAVGANGTILRNCDGVWEPEDCGQKNTLQAVGVCEGAVYAVGSGGLVLERISADS